MTRASGRGLNCLPAVPEARPPWTDACFDMGESGRAHCSASCFML